MNFLPNEKILIEANNKSVILTTHRIRQKVNSWGHKGYVSIMLEDISSCEYSKKSKPNYLVYGLSFAGIAFLLSRSSAINLQIASAISGLLSVILIFLYFASFKNGLFVSSSSSKIKLNTIGMKNEKVVSFIDTLEDAKNARYLKITLNDNPQNLQVDEVGENEDEEEEE